MASTMRRQLACQRCYSAGSFTRTAASLTRAVFTRRPLMKPPASAERSVQLMKRPPHLNQKDIQRLGRVYASKRMAKEPWWKMFEGQRRPYYKRPCNRQKPNWRNFVASEALTAKHRPPVSLGKKVLFWMDGGARILLRFVVVYIGAYLVSGLFMDINIMTGPSMIPLFNADNGCDVVITAPLLGRFNRFRLGAVVVARPPQQPTKHAAKRIRAMPGDVVSYNGEELTVPHRHVWLEGDNPYESTDSRNYGPVPYKNIENVVLFKIYPRAKEKPFFGAEEAETRKRRTSRTVSLVKFLIPLPLAYLFARRRIESLRAAYRVFMKSGGTKYLS